MTFDAFHAHLHPFKCKRATQVYSYRNRPIRESFGAWLENVGFMVGRKNTRCLWMLSSCKGHLGLFANGFGHPPAKTIILPVQGELRAFVVALTHMAWNRPEKRFVLLGVDDVEPPKAPVKVFWFSSFWLTIERLSDTTLISIDAFGTPLMHELQRQTSWWECTIFMDQLTDTVRAKQWAKKGSQVNLTTLARAVAKNE